MSQSRPTGKPVGTFHGEVSIEENLVCTDCPAQFVAGWVEKYEDDVCPDCGGKIIAKQELD